MDVCKYFMHLLKGNAYSYLRVSKDKHSTSFRLRIYRHLKLMQNVYNNACMGIMAMIRPPAFRPSCKEHIWLARQLVLLYI